MPAPPPIQKDYYIFIFPCPIYVGIPINVTIEAIDPETGLIDTTDNSASNILGNLFSSDPNMILESVTGTNGVYTATLIFMTSGLQTLEGIATADDNFESQPVYVQNSFLGKECRSKCNKCKDFDPCNMRSKF
jgi:hypothetical protein